MKPTPISLGETMSKKRILFVGEHPFGSSGNSHMMRSVLSQIEQDSDSYEVAVLAGGNQQVNAIPFLFSQLPFSIVNTPSNDPWGSSILIDTIHRGKFDSVIFVGIDIWRYSEILERIKAACSQLNVPTSAIFPYELQNIRQDWTNLINLFDFKYVYSEYGRDILTKAGVEGIEYFRPYLLSSELLKPTPEKKIEYKRYFFPHAKQDTFVFGFIGNNQVRKDPQALLKAFAMFKHQTKFDSILYMHTDFNDGVYNLERAAVDYGLKLGDLSFKRTGAFLIEEDMVALYNSFDCLVNCTVQEGLSWTPLEAMLCGVPVIASNNTAHIELLNECGVLVDCNNYTRVPVMSNKGQHWVDAVSCRPEDIAQAMYGVYKNDELRKEMSEKGLIKAQSWLLGCDDINNIITKSLKLRKVAKEESVVVANNKKKEILFVQHSAAGDVLMTTQCFRGIKEKHPGIPLTYMTQKVFQGIVENNPFVDNIVDYDEKKINDYEIVYNPHGEKILPGGWNNLDTKLASMYPYFCNVKADDMFIAQKKPDIELPDNYIVVHTTGGLSTYRTYKYMDKVMAGFKDENFVQIGSKKDMPTMMAQDLRGDLTWEESAWVMANAKAAIAIDSFPSHLAAAMGTPVIAIHGPAPSRVTGPIGKGKIICLDPDMLAVCPILSHCWGNPPPDKQQCVTPCINTISFMRVRKTLKELLEKT